MTSEEDSDTPRQPDEPAPGQEGEELMSLRDLIESAIPRRRRGGRYSITCAHPFDPDGLQFQQVEDAAQGWFVAFYGDLRSLGRRPRSMSVTVSQGRVAASCTLRLSDDEEAMSLREDLVELVCEHTDVSVQPLDEL